MFHDLLGVIEPEIVAQRAWDDTIAIHSIGRSSGCPTEAP